MKATNNRAVVFAYSNVGVRGLAAVLACNFNVPLVVTYDDNPQDNIWFDSVEELAKLNDIPVVKPSNANSSEIVELIRSLEPDWLFSFYYRNMLSEEILQIPTRGAFNMHGSLLPKFRGRAPTNWAVLKGETETGASFHRMEAKPDAGALIDQQAVPVLPNDTAEHVFHKVTYAAEAILMRTLPRLLAGTATETQMDLKQGSYFGGRKPEDGRIDWAQPAQVIHNLIRAVAPPYPGAFFEIKGDADSSNENPIVITGSYFRGLTALGEGPRLYWHKGQLWADCCDGKRLYLSGLTQDGHTVDQRAFQKMFGSELRLN